MAAPTSGDSADYPVLTHDNGETVTVLTHVTALLHEMDLRLQQRYDAQIKAVEAAFLAQQTAMQAALLAAEKAVQTALTAAEKAVTKAEVAAEKRFDAVNEFRAAYQDIINQQMPRAEGDARMAALSEKVDEVKQSVGQLIARGAGLNAGWGYLIGAVGLVAAVIAIVAGLHR